MICELYTKIKCSDDFFLAFYIRNCYRGFEANFLNDRNCSVFFFGSQWETLLCSVSNFQSCVLFKISTQISSNLPIGLRTLDVDDHTLSLLSIHCFGFCVVVVLFVTWFLHWTEMWIGCSCCDLCKIFDCRQQVRWQTTLSTTVQMRLNVNRFRLNWMRDDS